MKILVWSSYVNPNAGGQERVALDLANGLAKAGDDVVLAGPYSNAPQLQELISQDVGFEDFQPRRGLLGHRRSARFLRELASRRETEVISAHGSLAPLLGAGVPVVWTAHGADAVYTGVHRLLWRSVRRRLADGRWVLAAVSRFVADTICKRLRLSPQVGRVLHNGLASSRELRSLLAPEFKQPVNIGLVGRLEPEKRPLDLFGLEREMRSRGARCMWHVFGTGSMWEQMARMAAGRDNVRLHGLVDSAASIYSQLDVTILLAHGEKEGFPRVLVESRLAGRPVVGWNAHCIPEAVADHGITVDPPFDMSRFADALCKLLESPDNCVRSRPLGFDLESMVHAYRGTFRDVLQPA